MKLQRIIDTAVFGFCFFVATVASDVIAAEAPIDEILSAVHRHASVTPTEPCDDLTFLRRITLDLAGRVPTVSEIEQFEGSRDRAQVVTRLLQSEQFSRYWSQLWTTILVGRGQSGQSNREALRRWFEMQLQENKPLDQIAFDLISAEGVTTLDGNVNFLVANREDPITPVSRIFLGVQLDCARCHDHPFDRWTQDDYASMRKFLQTIQVREVSGGVRVSDTGRSSNAPDELPRFLTGAQPRTMAWRREMALMTVRCKPFARAMGNRVWQLLMGRGIVDPVDGLSLAHAPTVPKLHQALADQLRENGYDLRSLIRTICLSDAYARTNAGSADISLGDLDHDQAVDLFAARRPRPLLPEQLISSYAMIMNREVPSPESLNAMAVEFIGRSAARAGASDPLHIERTSQGLLQELASEASTPGGSIDSIFLSALARRPVKWERDRMETVSGSDMLYALLHCNEFVFSH